MKKAKAVWHLSATTTTILPAGDATAVSPVIQLKSLYSLISNGTEKRVASGQVPPQLHAQMRVPYQEGDFSFPVKYGYSLVGKVMSPGHRWLGRAVHLLHPVDHDVWK